MFVSFPSHCQESHGVHGSWCRVWQLVTALLAEQNLPPILGSAFSLTWIEIRSRIPDGNQGLEKEAEIQCCAAPQRLPVGNNKPYAGPCREERASTPPFAEVANTSQGAKLTKYWNMRPFHQDPNSHSMTTSVYAKSWLNFSSVSSLSNWRIKPYGNSVSKVLFSNPGVKRWEEKCLGWLK